MTEWDRQDFWERVFCAALPTYNRGSLSAKEVADFAATDADAAVAEWAKRFAETEERNA